jgi:hypothetical protein
MSSEVLLFKINKITKDNFKLYKPIPLSFYFERYYVVVNETLMSLNFLDEIKDIKEKYADGELFAEIVKKQYEITKDFIEEIASKMRDWGFYTKQKQKLEKNLKNEKKLLCFKKNYTLYSLLVNKFSVLEDLKKNGFLETFLKYREPLLDDKLKLYQNIIVLPKTQILTILCYIKNNFDFTAKCDEKLIENFIREAIEKGFSIIFV